MLGKNNVTELQKKNARKKKIYSLRKYSAGLASVAISSMFFLGSNSVLAAENTTETSQIEELGYDDKDQGIQPLSKSVEVKKQVETPAVIKIDDAEISAVDQSLSTAIVETVESVDSNEIHSEEVLAETNSTEMSVESSTDEKTVEQESVSTSTPETVSSLVEETTESSTEESISAEEEIVLEEELIIDEEAAVIEESVVNESDSIVNSEEKSLGESDGHLSELHQLIDGEIDREAVIRQQLAEIYSAEEIEGILSGVDKETLQNASAEVLMEKITQAGIDYAEKHSGFQMFAIQNATGRDVKDLIQFSDLQFKILGGDNPNELQPTSQGKIAFTGKYQLDNAIKAGDFFDVNYGDYVLPGGIDVPRNSVHLLDSQGNLIAQAFYDPESNTTRYIFTQYVDHNKDIKGSFNDQLVANRDTAVVDKKSYPVTVTIGNQTKSQDIIVDYGNNKNRKVVQAISELGKDSQGRKLFKYTIYLNNGGEEVGRYSDIRLLADKFHIDPDSLEVHKVKPKKSNNSAYPSQIMRDSLIPDLNGDSENYRVTKEKGNILNDGNKSRIHLGTMLANERYIVTMTFVEDAPGASDVLEKPRVTTYLHKDANPSGNPIAQGGSFIGKTSVSSTGESTEETGSFIEHHIYQTKKSDGSIVIDLKDDKSAQTGKWNEFYRTQKQDKEGYQLVEIKNLINNPKYNEDGSPATGSYKPEKTIEITYVYQKDETPTPEPDPNPSVKDELYEMTVEDEGFGSEFQYNKDLAPGTIKKVQEGRSGRYRVLYKHVNPEEIPTHSDGSFYENFVEINGKYWQEVSRETIQEARPDIFQYNFVTITETIKKEDGGVEIHYNDGTTIVIPGPEKPADPEKPLLPSQPIVEITPGEEDGRNGNYVTIKIYNPNTDVYESDKTIFIPDGSDGQNGQNGQDGKSPTAEVVDNGDGTHTITIT
ncbi:Ig-like domain-containing protein, partial [Facklamia sp. P12932]|uniref:Ig-like domain-containing protein n=1 Tax=Facklamia sp. P12932 TaxID=3421947 RepID=UPI003D16CF13